MKKPALIQLILGVVGVLLIIFLFVQPKFIVEDSPTQIVGEVTAPEAEEMADEQHSNVFSEEKKLAVELTEKYNSLTNSNEKLIFADSLGSCLLYTSDAADD